MFDRKSKQAISKIAKRLDVSAAALLAVAEVESGGRISARVRGRVEPIIRFEGHYFDRFLKGDALLEAREEKLASPKAGAIKNPRSQVERWKLLNRAIRINRTAALSSVSWGLGQVMGSHWSWLGYGSVDALVAEARSGVGGQVALMARYIEKAGLIKALQERDWTAFARTYNGPSFHKNRYDVKIAQAFVRWSKALGEQSIPQVANDITLAGAVQSDDDRLMFGSRGLEVKRLQQVLTKRGYILVADGLFGLITDRVVRQFQRDHLILENGIVGAVERGLIFGRREVVVTHARRAGSSIKLKLSRSFQHVRGKIKQAQDSLKTVLRNGLLSI